MSVSDTCCSRVASGIQGAMAFQLPLPQRLSSRGWKIKIRDKERLEDPHVTVIKGTDTWRWNLRSKSFMDRRPDPNLVDAKIFERLHANVGLLVAQWDKMYPKNKV